MSKIADCYLCNQKLNGEINVDHIPPKQFYAASIRKKYKLNLFTLQVHKACHKSFQKDEDYFVNSLAPVAMDSYSANELWKDLCVQFRRPEGRRIHEMVRREFEWRPSGLYLPFGKVAKNFNGERVRRVIWKITRGLFFKEMRAFLPENHPNDIEILSPREDPPYDFRFVWVTQSRGHYPGVFNYKYIDVDLRGVKDFHYWTMLFWDRLLALIKFHDPACNCDVCLNEKTKCVAY